MFHRLRQYVRVRTSLLSGLAFVVVGLSAAGASAAGGTQADYDRAEKLPSTTRNRVFRQRVVPHWINGGPTFWYRVQTSRENFEFVLVDPVQPSKQPAFDHQRLAVALGKAAKQSVNPKRLPFQDITFVDRETVEFQTFQQRWRCELKSYDVNKVGGARVGKSTNGSNAIIRDRIVPSRRSVAETWVEFHNKTDATVELFWIQESGSLQHYKQIKSGQKHNQHTFAGHMWVLQNADKKPLAVFEAVEKQATAVIDDRLPKLRTDQPDKTKKPNETGSNVKVRPKPSVNPPREWNAFIKDFNVHLRHRSTRKEVPLSTVGTEANRFSGRMTWSPDGKWLVAVQRREVETREVHLIESSPKDQLQPKLHTHRYAKPGDPLPIDRPRLFDVTKQREVEFPDSRFANPWSIGDLHWAADSSRFFFLHNQRGHQVLRLVSVKTDGTVETVIDEASPTFVDYANKKFLQHLDATHEIVWMSERDGWNHLYLIDADSGRVKQQITQGKWVVRRVDRVDTENRQIWFRASGIHADQDPYHIHFCRVDFDGKHLVSLTDGDGTHEIEYSPDRQFLIARFSRVDLPPETELRRVSDGRRILELERADWSELLATGWKPPERFVAKGRDAKTDIHGIIYRPTNFNLNRKYPVIEHIYAGPHGSHVPKRFTELHKPQMLAELGFIVVRLDGMGTSNRSKAFHDVAWKNLGDAGFPDRLPWIKAAAKKYPQLDLERIGIYGGSAGGQNALRGLLMYPDFYKAGVADCGCHDNRMDKVWWNELWMSWPIGPHYAEHSNVTHARRLQGKLLLIVGELDRNVDPASTMQVVNALIRADKDFEFLVMPGTGHGSAKYGTRRRRDFFVRHLLRVEPRRARSEPQGH